MKVLNIAQMILRLAFLLALILGIVFWVNSSLPDTNPALKDVHMGLGILVVLSLWVVGLVQGRLKGGSFGLAVGTFVVGLAVAIVGLWQISWKDAGANPELIDTIHLLLGLLAVGLGEMIVGRVKRATRAASA